MIFSGELLMYKFFSTFNNAIVHQYSWLPNTGYFLLLCFSCVMCIVFFLEKQLTVWANINIVLRTSRLGMLAIASKKLPEYNHKSTFRDSFHIQLLKSLNKVYIKLYYASHFDQLSFTLSLGSFWELLFPTQKTDLCRNLSNQNNYILYTHSNYFANVIS